MKQFLRTLVLPILLAVAGEAEATILTGTVSDTNGAPVTGTLFLTLSGNANLLSTGGCGGPAIVPVSPPAIFNLTNGVITGPGAGPYSVYGADCLTPTGLTYHLAATGPGGTSVLETDVSISGTSVDLGTLSPVQPSPNVPSQLAGDVTGPASATRVVGFRGISLVSTAPTSGQVIGFNGSAWAPTSITSIPGFIRADGTIPLTADWNAGLFNIKSKNSLVRFNIVTYGADPTGAADSTSAINAAITAAGTGGEVYLPPGTFNVTAAGTPIFLLTHPIHIRGDGIGSIIQVKTGTGAGVDVFTVTPASTSDSANYEFEDFKITPQSGTPGRHAIHVDITSSATLFVRQLRIQRMWLDALGGRAIKLDAPNPTNGIFDVQIRENLIFSGISLVNAGDSITISENTMTGANAAVDGTFIPGAGQLVIEKNNITSAGGISFPGGVAVGPRIVFNNMELIAAFTGTNAAFIDLDGSGSSIGNPTIFGNNITILAGGGTTNCLRMNLVDKASVDNNYFTTQAGGTAIVTTASATNISITPSNKFTGAGTSFAVNAASSQYTIGSIPFASTGGVLGQDNAQFFYNGASHLLGIGTTNPAFKAHVTGGVLGIANTTTDYAATTTGSALNLYLGANTGNTNAFVQATKTGGSATTDMGLQPSGGNVGIGTTTPLGALHINTLAGGEPTFRGSIIVNTPGGTTEAATGGIELKPDPSGAGYGHRIVSIFDGGSSYDLRLQARSNSASWTTRMNLTNAGSLYLAEGSATVNAAQVGGTVFTQTVSTTVANTTTETSLISSGTGSVTIPAILLTVGRQVRLKAKGIWNNGGTTPSATIKAKWGGTTIWTTGAFTPAAVAQVGSWTLEILFTCRTTGASGSLAQSGEYMWSENFGVPHLVGDITTTVPATIDTTAAKTIDLTWTWGTAAVADTVSLYNLSIEVLN